jgi:methylated-DNA-[protein]-cysteine S-methyltransferase
MIRDLQRSRETMPYGRLGSPYQAKYRAPFAVLGIRTGPDRLLGIDYLPRETAPLVPIDHLAEKVCGQIERYLDDPDFAFDLAFDYRGTPFQCRVWREISGIPAGRTLTYRDIARRLRTAPRPVGGACGANRIPIVIPCHRVLGSNGLGGFMHARQGFPLEVKRWLLRHEGVPMES